MESKRIEIKKKKKMNNLKIGSIGTVSKTISESDIYLFAGIIGDFNPIHVNEEFAKRTKFGTRIVYGMLLCSFFHSAISSLFKDLQVIYLSQKVKFIAPAIIGDTIFAEAKVIQKINQENRLLLKTTMKNQKGKIIVDGEAIIRLF